MVDYRDMPIIRSIEQEAGRNNYKFSSFVFGIVKSMPFQMRKAEGGEGRTDSVTATSPPDAGAHH